MKFSKILSKKDEKVTPIAKPQAIMAKRKQEIENQKGYKFPLFGKRQCAEG